MPAPPSHLVPDYVHALLYGLGLLTGTDRSVLILNTHISHSSGAPPSHLVPPLTGTGVLIMSSGAPALLYGLGLLTGTDRSVLILNTHISHSSGAPPSHLVPDYVCSTIWVRPVNWY